MAGLFPPQDRDGGLPSEVPLTPLAAERVAREAADRVFDAAARSLNLDWQTQWDGKQVQRWSERMGDRLVAARAEEINLEGRGVHPEGPAHAPLLLVVGMDGGRVPTRDKDPQTQSRWREDKVASFTSYIPGDGKEQKPRALVTTYTATMKGVKGFGDIDGEVCNFFRTLREQTDDLVKAIGLTPFSREEFARACELDPTLSALERARRFYVRARQVRTGLAQRASVGRWANCKNTSRAGMSGVISRWLGAATMLPGIAARLLRVQIENRPAIQTIRLYDSPETLFYCDPPYVHETRGDPKAYGHEMTDEQHRELAAVLNQVKGRVALSNYPCPLMDSLYPPGKWWKIVAPARTNHSTKDKRTEALWTNYNPADITNRKPGANGRLFLDT